MQNYRPSSLREFRRWGSKTTKVSRETYQKGKLYVCVRAHKSSNLRQSVNRLIIVPKLGTNHVKGQRGQSLVVMNGRKAVFSLARERNPIIIQHWRQYEYSEGRTSGEGETSSVADTLLPVTKNKSSTKDFELSPDYLLCHKIQFQNHYQTRCGSACI